MKRILAGVLILLVIFGGVAAAVLLRVNRYLILSLLCFTAVFYMVALWALFKDYAEAIRRAALFADKVAGGDLSERIYLRDDEELGLLSESLNRMAASLGLMLSELRSSAAEISEAAALSSPPAPSPAAGTDLASDLRTVENAFSSIIGECSALGDALAAVHSRFDPLDTSLRKTAEALQDSLRNTDRLQTLSAFVRRVTEKTRLAALNAGFAASPDLPETLRLAAEQAHDALQSLQALLEERLQDLREAAAESATASELGTAVRTALSETARHFRRISSSLEEHQTGLARLRDATDTFTVESRRGAERLGLLVGRIDALSRRAERIAAIVSRFRTGEEP